ncbi:MAG: hypothetical protein Q8N68_00130 [bacterium]|nr:hypothetical protein [bacterium]
MKTYLVLVLLCFGFFVSVTDLDTVPKEDLNRAYLIIGIASLLAPLLMFFVVAIAPNKRKKNNSEVENLIAACKPKGDLK